MPEKQYREGDIDASVTGQVVMWEDASNTVRTVSATKPLPVDATGAGDVPVTLDSEVVELSSITVDLLLDGITGIVRELRLMNLHMASITGLDINREDVEA